MIRFVTISHIALEERVNYRKVYYYCSYRASSSPLLCPHLKPPTFHFFNPPEVFLKGQFNFQKQYAPRVYINSSSVTIWILVEVRWAITSIVTFMDGYFGPTHMVFLSVQYLNIFGPDRLESTILKITSL